MPIDKDTALNFYAQAAQSLPALPVMTEDQTFLSMTVMLGEAINAYNTGDANIFRRRLGALVALCGVAEQWTQRADDCECPECSANAAAEDRAKREQQESDDLTLKDFWWTIHGDSASSPLGGMIVTRQRSAYAHIPLDAWKLVRARDFGHAVVKASEQHNVKG